MGIWGKIIIVKWFRELEMQNL